MDAGGNVIEQPYDDTVNPRGKTRQRCLAKAYPVKECAGLLFAYMGPQPAPDLPVWEPSTWENGFREVVLSNALQLVSVPGELLRPRALRVDARELEHAAERQTAPYAAKHLKLVFEEFDYGHVYKRVREGQKDGDPVWTVGRVTLWPNRFYLGNHFEWRASIDDENTLSVCWLLRSGAEGARAVRAGQGPDLNTRRSRTTTAVISSHVINQDIIASVETGRGRRPYQGEPRRLRPRHRDDAQAALEELDAVAKGAEPKGTVRSANLAKCVDCQHHQEDVDRGHHAGGARQLSAAQGGLKGFRHCFGRPPEVRKAFCDAIGRCA